MSNITRHYGTVEATGSRCIVVFRELPDNPQKALIVYRDSLPEIYALSLSRVVNGSGQNTKDLYEVLTREYTPDGADFLTTLHNLGKLHAVETSKIVMQVTPSYNIRLDQLNAQIRGDDTPQEETNKDLQKKLNPYKEQNEAEADINAKGIAERLLMEAQDFENEALNKRNRAYELRPELKPQTVVEDVIESVDTAKTFSLDLEGVSQRKAIQQLQDFWRVVNGKKDSADSEVDTSVTEKTED